MSFDFFFTHPYQSLKIDSSDDVLTTVLLLVIGLLVAEIVTYSRRHRRSSEHRGDEIARLHRVAELVASDSDAEDVVLSVQAELIGLLSLRDCRFERAPFPSELPTLERNGSIAGDHRHWIGGEYTLPSQGAEIPVLGRGKVFGRLVLVPDLTVGVSIEERIVAVALSDQLGAAFAADSLGGLTPAGPRVRGRRRPRGRRSRRRARARCSRRRSRARRGRRPPPPIRRCRRRTSRTSCTHR